MSRSYKKNPVTTNSGSSYRKFAKNYSNRIIRRFSEDVQDGRWYKKLWDSWNICDFKIRWKKESLFWPLWKAKMK